MRKIKYNERLERLNSIAREKAMFLASIQKICPRCGSILPLSAKGCDTCLIQFERKGKNVKRIR